MQFPPMGPKQATYHTKFHHRLHTDYTYKVDNTTQHNTKTMVPQQKVGMYSLQQPIQWVSARDSVKPAGV